MLRELQNSIKSALMDSVTTPQAMLMYFYCGEQAFKLMHNYQGVITFTEAALLKLKWSKRGLDADLIDKVFLIAGVDVAMLPILTAGGAVLAQPLDSGFIHADGTEQIVAEITQLNRMSGYLSLRGMQAGDVVVLRQYVKLRQINPYELYDETPYSDEQLKPVVYVKSKEGQFGIKFTLQQTAGTFRDFDYDFFKEG